MTANEKGPEKDRFHREDGVFSAVLGDFPAPAFLTDRALALLSSNAAASKSVAGRRVDNLCSVLGCRNTGPGPECGCPLLDAVRRAVDEGLSSFAVRFEIHDLKGFTATVFPLSAALSESGVAVVLLDFPPRSSESVYRRLVVEMMKAGNAFFVAISSRGRLMMINDAMLKRLGRTREEVLGADYLETFVPEDERGKLRRAFESILQSDETAVVTNDVLTADGERLTVEWHGRRVKDKKGGVRFFFGIGLDVTERIKMERELRASEQRLRTVFDRSPFGLVLYDPKSGGIELANAAFCSFVGRPPEEVMGADPSAFVHPGDWEKYRPLLETFYESDEVSYVVEERFLRPDGSEVWGRVVFAPLREEPYGGMLVIVEDIDEIKRREKMLREWEDYVARMERMEAVWAENLAVLHDIANIFTTIEMISAVLERFAHDPDRVRKEAATLCRLLEHGNKLKNRLAEACASDEKPRPADLRELLSEALELSGARYRKGLNLEIDLGDEPFPVFCYPTELRRAFVNVVRNALDVMPEAGTLAVRAYSAAPNGIFLAKRPKPESGLSAVVEISDTGPGIPPGLRSRIFDFGFSTKKHDGAGMGLFQVNKAVERHNGVVDVESEEGSGTRFIFRFPLHVPAAPRESAPAPAKAKKTALKRRGLLLFEENAVLRETLAETLANEGFETFAAEDLGKTTETAKRCAGELGAALLNFVSIGEREMAALERMARAVPGMKIICATVEPPPPDTARALSRLGVVRLGKPHDIDELKDILTGGGSR